MLDSGMWWIVVVGGIAIGVAQGISNSRKLAAAKRAYLAHLNLLKASPCNPSLKQRTLELGRSYSNLTRDKKGVALFDEVAIMNDIGAATAAATSLGKTSASDVDAPSTEERLEKVYSLYERNLISSDDYKRQKDRILSEV